MDDLTILQDLYHAACVTEYENGFDCDIDLEAAYSDTFVELVRSRISQSQGIALIAEAGEVVAGYLLGVFVDGKKGRHAKLEGIFVLPEHRMQGIASQLVSVFLSWAQDVGSTKASVAVAPRNAPAVELYRKHGFMDQTLILETPV